ncbi:aldose 1-epimerase [Vibrio sp. SCSIO 43135]|uniref:aldose epimerase family protein n=1 Tax=Vibrio sp. SCSIO 43135 TaxID=2819096 RepID=UPI002075A8B9|nr:aldose 1-epimerase [Vibrio sp. SCSIO 43135]USD43659.1 aldose 1-epimerase [Vibrio sp. SCSIO 43135]
MFKIKKDNFNNLSAVKILNPNLGIEVQIIEEFGAIVNKYIVNHSPFSFISGYQNCDDLMHQHPFFSRSAKLFPFPNRLNLGHYQYNQQSYQLPANFPWSAHAVHGLVYNQPFKLIDSQASEQHAEITLRFSTQDLDQSSLHSGYPFGFQLDIQYRVEASGQLSCSTHITNLGDDTMPMGDAWHPYFTLGCPLDNCTLHMPDCLELEHQHDLPTGQKTAYDAFSPPSSLEGQCFNHCFEFGSNQSVELTLQRQDGLAQLTFQQGSGYRFVQLYTPDSEPSIAIEPMTCPADAFNNRIGLIELLPNQTISLAWQCHARYSNPSE